MRLPNKVTSYSESVLSKLPIILEKLCDRDMSPYDLYKEVKGSFIGVLEYIDALDCLFALKVLAVNDENGEIHYAV